MPSRYELRQIIMVSTRSSKAAANMASKGTKRKNSVKVCELVDPGLQCIANLKIESKSRQEAEEPVRAPRPATRATQSNMGIRSSGIL